MNLWNVWNQMDTLKNLITDLWHRNMIHVRKFWENIGRWFSYYPICRKMYDWDYSSILEAERHQMKRIRNYVLSYTKYFNGERIAEEINLALRLLDIIEENGCSVRVGKPIEFKQCEDNPELYELVFDPNEYYTIPVYVNTRNSNRFWKMDSKYFDPPRGNLYRDMLRIRKAWNLYHKLKCYCMQGWWI